MFVGKKVAVEVGERMDLREHGRRIYGTCCRARRGNVRAKEGSRVKSRNLLRTAGCFSQRWGTQGWGEGEQLSGRDGFWMCQV